MTTYAASFHLGTIAEQLDSLIRINNRESFAFSLRTEIHYVSIRKLLGEIETTEELYDICSRRFVNISLIKGLKLVAYL